MHYQVYGLVSGRCSGYRVSLIGLGQNASQGQGPTMPADPLSQVNVYCYLGGKAGLDGFCRFGVDPVSGRLSLM